MRAKLPAAVDALGLTSLLNDAASEMVHPLLPGIVALFLGYGVYFGLVVSAQRAFVAEVVPAAARASGFDAYHLWLGWAPLRPACCSGSSKRATGRAWPS